MTDTELLVIQIKNGVDVRQEATNEIRRCEPHHALHITQREAYGVPSTHMSVSALAEPLVGMNLSALSFPGAINAPMHVVAFTVV